MGTTSRLEKSLNRFHKLNHYVQDLFKWVAPSLTLEYLIIINNKIHQIPKPAHLPQSVPHDALLQIHFSQAKEKILSALRHMDQLPEQYSRLQLLPGLSQYTLQRHKNLAIITKALRNDKIIPHCRYPCTLVITHDGETSTYNGTGRGSLTS